MVTAQQPELTHYKRGTIGHHMTTKVPIVHKNATIESIKRYLTEHIRQFDTINYIYVTDEQNHLLNMFSIKELYRSSPTTEVSHIPKRNPFITLPPEANQEEAAYVTLKNNIKAIPVVNNENVFLGVVPNETIITVIYRELRKDILQMAGIQKSNVNYDNIFEIPFFQAVKHRIPWLLLGLLGGVAAAQVIGEFEKTLEQNLILAAFIPLVVYIADAVGTQLEAFTIRDFALFRKLDLRKYLFKQISIISVVASLLAGAIFVISVLLYQDVQIAIVLCLSILTASLSSVLTGIMIPLFFRRFKLDPANASGPIGTIIQDILSVFIYFIIATWLLL